MFGNRNSNVQSNQSISQTSKNRSSMGVVYKVILDTDDPLLDDLEIVDELKSKYIGAIQFRLNNSANKKDESLPIALPYNKTNISLPTINETIRITSPGGGGYVYERIIGSPLPNV